MPISHQRPAGKTAVITGPASGQGRAAALAFAEAGALIVGCDMDDDGAAATVSQVTAAGCRMSSSHVDLTNEAAMASWAEKVAAAYDQVHILYADAAVTRFAAIEHLTFADWRWNVEHEMDVIFLPVKYVWPQLIKSRDAAIVLVGSTVGVSGLMINGRLAHTATKGAVVAMGTQLAAEGAPHGLRVNAMSPGMIRTATTQGNLLAPEHPMRFIADSIPLAGSARQTKSPNVRCSLPRTKRPM